MQDLLQCIAMHIADWAWKATIVTVMRKVDSEIPEKGPLINI